jgi:hypothetical protein
VCNASQKDINDDAESQNKAGTGPYLKRANLEAYQDNSYTFKGLIITPLTTIVCCLPCVTGYDAMGRIPTHRKCVLHLHSGRCVPVPEKRLPILGMHPMS